MVDRVMVNRCRLTLALLPKWIGVNSNGLKRGWNWWNGESHGIILIVNFMSIMCPQHSCCWVSYDWYVSLYHVIFHMGWFGHFRPRFFPALQALRYYFWRFPLYVEFFCLLGGIIHVRTTYQPHTLQSICFRLRFHVGTLGFKLDSSFVVYLRFSVCV